MTSACFLGLFCRLTQFMGMVDGHIRIISEIQIVLKLVYVRKSEIQMRSIQIIQICSVETTG